MYTETGVFEWPSCDIAWILQRGLQRNDFYAAYILNRCSIICIIAVEMTGKWSI